MIRLPRAVNCRQSAWFRSVEDRSASGVPGVRVRHPGPVRDPAGEPRRTASGRGAVASHRAGPVAAAARLAPWVRMEVVPFARARSVFSRHFDDLVAFFGDQDPTRARSSGCSDWTGKLWAGSASGWSLAAWIRVPGWAGQHRVNEVAWRHLHNYLTLDVACQRDGTTSLPRAWDHLEVSVSIAGRAFGGSKLASDTFELLHSRSLLQTPTPLVIALVDDTNVEDR